MIRGTQQTMNLPRFRVRTLLILVMLTGFGVGGYVLYRKSLAFWRFKCCQDRSLGN